MKATIYARTSKDDDNGDGTKSIPEQVADCQALAKAHGYSVLLVIKEPNRSGRTYPTGCSLAGQDAAVSEYFNGKPNTRDGLAEVLRRLPQVDVVVVRDITRLARPLSDSFLLNWLHQQFKSHGTKIHTVRDGLQDPTQQQNLLLRTITSMSEDSGIQTRRAHSKRKLSENKDAGKLASGCKIFGYKHAGHQKVEIEPKAAALVRRIYKLRLDGDSLNRRRRFVRAQKKSNLYLLAAANQYFRTKTSRQ